MSHVTRKLNCSRGCCTLDIGDYKSSNLITRPRNNSKAGGLIYDRATNSILIIQSYGNLWGAPKGTLELDETPENGAIREIMEETGLVIDKNTLGDMLIIDDTSTYYLIEHERCDVSIQNDVVDNDVNSIGWVNLDCLKKFVDDSVIKLTKHTELILKHFLNI